MVSEAKKRANKKYDTKTYDVIPIQVKKGGNDKLKEAAEKHNISLNSYIKRAIQADMSARGVNICLEHKMSEND